MKKKKPYVSILQTPKSHNQVNDGIAMIIDNLLKSFYFISNLQLSLFCPRIQEDEDSSSDQQLQLQVNLFI